LLKIAESTQDTKNLSSNRLEISQILRKNAVVQGAAKK